MRTWTSSPRVSPGRAGERWGIALALVLAGAAAAAAQSEPALLVHAYTLRHQPAAEALALVHPLLSERGSVQLQPGGNTLVIRDEQAVVERVAALLREFDHAAKKLAIRIQVVRAGNGGDGARLDLHDQQRFPVSASGRVQRPACGLGGTARCGFPRWNGR